MKSTIFLLLCMTLLLACDRKQTAHQISQEIEGKRPGKNRAKFEPPDGKVLVFAGQELTSVGGLKDYNDGYLDHYKKPAGWTSYTFLTPGDTSFGFVHKGLDGIWTTDDWGDNDYNMSLQLEDPNFSDMILAIGLAMVSQSNHEKKVAAGEYDEMLKKFGGFLQSLAPRPVFLRIGYEFDGHGWNHYDIDAYKKAFRHIKELFDSMNIDNVAYVWQSTGWVSTQENLEEWYPGDEYVDWCAYSFFSRWKEAEMIDFARKHDKPVFIAEATPTISDHTVKFDGNTKTTVLSDPNQAQEAWDHWFVPFFKTINGNPDVVKAFSYINCNWKSHPMWKSNPTFKRIDARLETSELIDRMWKEELSKASYIHSYPSLYENLLQETK